VQRGAWGLAARGPHDGVPGPAPRLNPWDRLNPPYDPPGGYDDPGEDGDPGDDAPAASPENPAEDASFPDANDGGGRFPDHGYGEDEDEDDGEGDEGGDGDNGGPGNGPSGTPGRPGGPAGQAPLPALTTITVSAGTLFGWSDAPAEIAGFGLIAPGDARDLIAAASQHPRSRWCVTILGTDGEAIAHGCAAGPHPWPPPVGNRDGPAQLAEFLRQLKITPAPIAKGECDHQHREDRYRPSRKLQHLIRARTTTCPAPGCNAQAIHNELDHTISWPVGITDECELSPPCSRHHHAKHAPHWKLLQPEPGVMRWTPPSGRTYTTRPTRYDE
jgi:hypothetical protein